MPKDSRTINAMRLVLLAVIAGATGLMLLSLAGAGAAQPRPVERPAPVRPTGGAPVLSTGSPRAIPNQYIVVMADEGGRQPASGLRPNPAVLARRDAAIAMVRQLGGKVGFTYSAALVGFSATLPSAAAVERLRTVPGIAWIEADQRFDADTTQLNPPAGMDRTSERLLPLDQKFTYGPTGSGVHVYIIDSGILASHTQFGGRVTGGFTAITDGNGTNDCTGHGTHVAGTVGGIDYGIAEAVSLHPVRVLDCSSGGTATGIIAGIDWVTQNAVHPAVANMSLGGPASVSMDTAVTNSVASGVTYVVSAGNNTTNACNQSPARTPDAITVGSSVPGTDTVASNSNFGPCVDLFGPGVGILSANIGSSNAATAIKNGTSMAAPHVAGVAAMILELYPTATPATVWTWIHYAANVVGTPGWAGLSGLRPVRPTNCCTMGRFPGATASSTATRTSPPSTGSTTTFRAPASTPSCADRGLRCRCATPPCRRPGSRDPTATRAWAAASA